MCQATLHPLNPLSFHQLNETLVDNTDNQQIVPGITLTPSGQATVDTSLTDVLMELAIKLEELTDLPVDVEHVLAGVVLAARSRELDPITSLSTDDPALIRVLMKHVKSVFQRFEGKVGNDD